MTIGAKHKAIKRYYETLGRLHAQGIEHETGVRTAFQISCSTSR